MLINRKSYFYFLILTIFLGLLSRKLMIFPAELGDALWAVAVYLGYRLILMSTNQRTTAILALVTSFVVEWSQLLMWD